MANKKSKTGKGRPGKASGKKPSPPVREDKQDAAALLNPAERVAAVRPMWEQRQHDARVQLLTIDLETLRQQAKAVADRQRASAVVEGGVELVDYNLGDCSLEDILEEGLRRLNTKETWKVWQFGGQEFFDAESFRTYVHEHHIKEDLLRLLPKDDPKGTVERPAEAALRQRMTDLLAQVQSSSRQAQEEQQGLGGQQCAGAGGRGRRAPRNTPEQTAGLVRDGNVEMISIMLDALEKEHEQLYQSLLRPITTFVIDMLPEEMRETTLTELHYEDLDKLNSEDVTRIVEWLTEKVDALSSRLKAEQKEEEEEDDGEPMGDVDLFALTQNDALTVNSKWLQHLEERLLGEDGHPRKSREVEDPHRMGLVLEWVYGSIVSTAEKSRDGAKRQLGLRPPTAQQAYDNLIKALEDQAGWEARAKQAKLLLNDMLQSRKEAAELSKRYDIRPIPADGAAASQDANGDSESNMVPDEVIIKMLDRESLLTQAKLHALEFDRSQGMQQLQRLRSQIRQGEPELERLKRELEELKHAPRSLESSGTFRTAAEMERHKHQMADAAIEEQLEVQTAFREQGAKLQSLYDKKQRTEFEMAKRETEMKQLNGWKATVENLRERFDDLTKQMELLADIELGQQACHGSRSPSPASADAAAVAAEEGMSGPLAASATILRSGVLTPQHSVQRNKLRQHFHKDVRKQLYSDADDRNFFNRIKDALKHVESRLEEGRVALQHLELFLMNVACDDPGAAIGSQLVLPLLQERLDEAALEYKAERAKLAEEEIIAMEAAAAAAKAAEEEKRKQQAQKKKGKTKTDKERLAAGKAAQEAAELEKKRLQEEERKRKEEEERQERQKQLELIRQQEEELMAARRQQLMAEDGYWAQRMAEEQQRAALAMAIGELGASGDVRSSSDSMAVSSSSSSSNAGEANGTKAPDASSEDGTVSVTTNTSGLVDEDGFVSASSRSRSKRNDASGSREWNNRAGDAAYSADRRHQQQQPMARGLRNRLPNGSEADRAADRNIPRQPDSNSSNEVSSNRQARSIGRFVRDAARSEVRDGSRERFRERKPFVAVKQTSTAAAPPDSAAHTADKQRFANAAPASDQQQQQKAAWAEAAAAVAAAASQMSTAPVAGTASNQATAPSSAAAATADYSAPANGRASSSRPAASSTAVIVPDGQAAVHHTQGKPLTAASVQPAQGPSVGLAPHTSPVEAPTTPAAVAPSAHVPAAAPVTTVVVKDTAVVVTGVEPPVSVKSITFGSLEEALDELDDSNADDAAKEKQAGDSVAGTANKPPVSQQQQQQDVAAADSARRPAAVPGPAGPQPGAAGSVNAVASGAGVSSHPSLPVAVRPGVPVMMGHMPHMMMPSAAGNRVHGMAVGPVPLPPPMAVAAVPAPVVAAASRHHGAAATAQVVSPTPLSAGAAGGPVAVVPLHGAAAGMRPVLVPSMHASPGGPGYARPPAHAVHMAQPAAAVHAHRTQQVVREREGNVRQQLPHHQQQQQQPQQGQTGLRGTASGPVSHHQQQHQQHHQQHHHHQQQQSAGPPSTGSSPQAAAAAGMVGPPIAMVPGMAPSVVHAGMVPGEPYAQHIAGFAAPHLGVLMPPPAMGMMPGMAPPMGPGGLGPSMPVPQGPRAPYAPTHMHSGVPAAGHMVAAAPAAATAPQQQQMVPAQGGQQLSHAAGTPAPPVCAQQQQQQQQQGQPPPPPKAPGPDGPSSTNSSLSSNSVNPDGGGKPASKSSLRVSARPFIPSSFRMQQQAVPASVPRQDVMQVTQQLPQLASQQQSDSSRQHSQQQPVLQQHSIQHQHLPQQQQPQQLAMQQPAHPAQMPGSQQQQQHVSQQPMQQQYHQQQLAYMQYQQQLHYQQQQHLYGHQLQQQREQHAQQQQGPHVVATQQSAGMGFKQQQYAGAAGPGAPAASVPRQVQHQAGMTVAGHSTRSPRMDAHREGDNSRGSQSIDHQHQQQMSGPYSPHLQQQGHAAVPVPVKAIAVNADSELPSQPPQLFVAPQQQAPVDMNTLPSNSAAKESNIQQRQGASPETAQMAGSTALDTTVAAARLAQGTGGQAGRSVDGQVSASHSESQQVDPVGVVVPADAADQFYSIAAEPSVSNQAATVSVDAGKQQAAVPLVSSRSWSSIAAKADTGAVDVTAAAGSSPTRPVQASSTSGTSTVGLTAVAGTGSDSSSGNAGQPQGPWRSGSGSLKSKLQRGNSSQQLQQQAPATGSSAGKTVWPALGGGSAAEPGDAAAAGSSPRAAAGSWAKSVGNSSGGSSTIGAAAAGAGVVVSTMGRNSSTGSLKGQEAAVFKQQQQQVSRSSRQSGDSSYAGTSGIRLDHSPSKITITKEHGIVFEGPRGVLGTQRLVRGLYNEEGQYNCFLNVIIQALWHLRSFRQRLLQLPAAAASGNMTAAVPAADVKILQALRAVFDELAKAPELPTDQQQPGKQESSSSGRWLVSPAVLREALSGLELGAAAISIELSEMHDASEVLNEVFTALHRAEAGKATGIADDPHLPTKVKVKQELFATRKPAAEQPAAPQQQQQQPQQPKTLAHILQMQNGVGHGAAAKVQAGSKGAHLSGPGVTVKPPNSLVHKLFGLDVLQAHAADAGLSSGRAAGFTKRGAATIGGPAKDVGAVQVEALQFMKFFHLMPAQALRASYERHADTCFEVVLREAEAADHSSTSSTGAGSWGSVSHGKAAAAAAGEPKGTGAAPGGTRTVLLRRPAVFTLAVVWESPKAPLDSIKGTVNALGPTVELSNVFGGLPAGALYNLRSVICYFGHHYQAFILSEELQQWLLFDDHVIKVVGDWQQVQQAMISNRLQPSLLFFESTDA